MDIIFGFYGKKYIKIIAIYIILYIYCSSNSSLTENLEHCKIDFGIDFESYIKSLYCSDDFDFQFIDLNYFHFIF